MAANGTKLLNPPLRPLVVDVNGSEFSYVNHVKAQSGAVLSSAVIAEAASRSLPFLPSPPRYDRAPEFAEEEEPKNYAQGRRVSRD